MRTDQLSNEYTENFVGTTAIGKIYLIIAMCGFEVIKRTRSHNRAGFIPSFVTSWICTLFGPKPTLVPADIVTKYLVAG